MTERRKPDQTLQQLLQSSKFELLGSLMAGIAHEINNPLHYIKNNALFIQQNLQVFVDCAMRCPNIMLRSECGETSNGPGATPCNTAEPEDLPSLVDEISGAVDDLVEGVELIIKLTAAMAEFSSNDFDKIVTSDLNALLRGAVLLCTYQCKYLAKINLDLAPDLPEYSFCPTELGQALLNLIINAIQAISEAISAGTIRKGCLDIASSYDDKWITIKISDTGRGIPLAVQNEVFELFSTTKLSQGAAGCGLTLAREIIVTKYKGEIDFSSTEGTGTSFTVKLPRYT